ncbi:MAG: coniferyl aldehyde dehydrogenase [SAR324 cluster bacterium]|nr:coniferyl aldehyde dehydrogenase [SAR324 cluster bacterium]
MNEIQENPGSLEKLQPGFDQMREAQLADPMPELETRRDRLQRLLKGLEEREEALTQAISMDFGQRSAFETANYDITVTLADIKYQIRNLARWMRIRKRSVPLHLMPGRARIVPQPLGVVGVISPWNFPVFLSLSPVAGAIAAGNRVMLKPSEWTPKTSALLAELASEAFEPDEFAVFEGGIETGRAFSELPFDHLLFTGSTRVAKEVSNSAAKNLTPLTLELGGKSPALVCPGANLKRAAERIVFGKLANAGQICIAPDYVFVERAKFHDFIEMLQTYIKKAYPRLNNNPDYTSIISADHFSRLNRMIEEAREDGAEIISINPDGETLESSARKIPPTLILRPNPTLGVMQEEIFGPILPVLSYEKIEEAIEFIQHRARPLALYLFTEKTRERERILRETVSGGVAVNEVLFHCVCETLPFGGVGASGMGSYHGQAGFDTFSHLKPVFIQPRFNFNFFLVPPITPMKRLFAKIFRKLV